MSSSWSRVIVGAAVGVILALGTSFALEIFLVSASGAAAQSVSGDESEPTDDTAEVAPDPTNESSPTPANEAESVSSDPSQEAVSGREPQVATDIVDAILGDAGARPGADAANVQLLNAQPVAWPDRSLGCPEPGRVYAQVMTPGWLVEVQVATTILEYHAASISPIGLRIVLCSEHQVP